MDVYPGHEATYEDLAVLSQLAAEQAHDYLDENGLIDYARFDDDTLRMLDDGPGRVTEPARIDPYHVGTTPAEFAELTNNFYLLFNDFWGATSRTEPYYQRFSILFPYLAQALINQHPARPRDSRGIPFVLNDPSFFEPLRTAYGILSQLVGMYDKCGTQQVRDRPFPTSVLCM